jgi:iron(III) transport system substrate-binding protein
MRKLLFGSLLMTALLVTSGAYAQTQSVNLDKLTAEQLLPLAQKEGKVTILTISSRMSTIKTSFEAKYPGITVETVEMPSVKMIARVTAEQQAKAYVTDVMYMASAPVVQRDLLDKGYAIRYVPPRLGNELSDEFTKPLLVHRLTARTIMYNENAYPNGSPVTNLWQLTTPEWKGKVVISDPTLNDVSLNMLTVIALHPEEMAAAYEKLFKKSIEIDSDLRGAGEQFIRNLYRNDMILVSDDETLYSTVGALGKKDPPVGLMNYSARRNNKSKNLALQTSTAIDPAIGIRWQSFLTIAENSPHPAASRLLIDFLMGDDTPTGGPGFEPFNVPGDYSPRKSIKNHPDAIPLGELNLWGLDPAKVAARQDRITDLILGE